MSGKIVRAMQDDSDRSFLSSGHTGSKLADELYEHLMMIEEFSNLSMDFQGELVADLAKRIEKQK